MGGLQDGQLNKKETYKNGNLEGEWLEHYTPMGDLPSSKSAIPVDW